MSAPGAAAAQERAIGLARDAGRLLSVDPNFRPALWSERDAMVAASRDLVARATIVKASADELQAMSGRDTIAAGVEALWHAGLRLFAVTSGAAGAELFTAERRLAVPGFAVDAVDTTGAGDAFMACLLSELLKAGLAFDDEAVLKQALSRAAVAGAITTTRRGAMGSMPDEGEITRFLASRS